jgi:uncharacterized membrane protein HdeD (DUF308 family)
MLAAVGKNWWLLLVQGAVAILFGLGAMLWPGATLAALIGLFGAFALVDGVMALVAMFKSASGTTPWWLWLLRGITGIAAGLATFAWPGLTALMLVYVIAARYLLDGLFEIVAAVQLRKEIQGEWLMVAGGALSVILGLWLFAAPGAGALALAWMIGIFAIVIGGTLIALGFRVRGLHERLQARAPAHAH